MERTTTSMVASQHNYTPHNITFQKCHNIQNAPAKQLTRKVFFVRMSLHEALKSKGLRLIIWHVDRSMNRFA